jgi:hypothetical protein
MCEVLPQNARVTLAALLAAGVVVVRRARRVGAHAVLRDGRIVRLARRGCA